MFRCVVSDTLPVDVDMGVDDQGSAVAANLIPGCADALRWDSPAWAALGETRT
jgi:hypothetical protein